MKGCQSVFRPPVRRSPGSADVLIRSGGRLITKSPPIPPPVIPTIRDPALRENRRLPQHKVGLRRLQSSAGIPPVNLKSEICNLKSLWKESTIRIAYSETAGKRLGTGMDRMGRVDQGQQAGGQEAMLGVSGKRPGPRTHARLAHLCHLVTYFITTDFKKS